VCRSRAPRVRCLGTAAGDSPFAIASFYDAALQCGLHGSHLTSFPMPHLDHVREHPLDQDVMWVGGGGGAGLLAIWRLHGWDEILHELWQTGIGLTGTSAGSICWHVGGTTDSFGPTLHPVTNGLAFLP
jgi:peptidase E